MSQSEIRTNATSAAPAQAVTAWPRPTLVELPPLRDLTLQSGAAAIEGGVGTSSLMGF